MRSALVSADARYRRRHWSIALMSDSVTGRNHPLRRGGCQTLEEATKRSSDEATKGSAIESFLPFVASSLDRFIASSGCNSIVARQNEFGSFSRDPFVRVQELFRDQRGHDRRG